MPEGFLHAYSYEPTLEHGAPAGFDEPKKRTTTIVLPEPSPSPAPQRKRRKAPLSLRAIAVTAVAVVVGGGTHAVLESLRAAPSGLNLVAAAFLAGMLAYAAVLMIRGLTSIMRQDPDAEDWTERLKARLDASPVKPLAAPPARNNVRAWKGYRKFIVVRKVEACKGVTTLYLVPQDLKPLPAFLPGQHLTLRINLPDEPKPLIRCYSLSDSPKQEYYRLSVKKVAPPPERPEAPDGRVSSYIHDVLKEGDVLDVQAPKGSFHLNLAEQKPLVLICGGIGITPVLSMLNAVAESGSPRETWMFVGARDLSEFMQKDYLERLAQDHPNIRLHVCLSQPRQGDIRGETNYHAERVTLPLLQRLLPSNQYDFYLCGPPAMMEEMTAGLAAWGVPEGRIRYEAFGPASVRNLKARMRARAGAAEPQADDEAPRPAVKVTFAKSGKTIDWNPEAESLLEFAERNRIFIDCGCRAGNCGTCVTTIHSGEIDYIGEPGQPLSRGSCLTCISVPKNDISLDA